MHDFKHRDPKTPATPDPKDVKWQTGQNKDPKHENKPTTDGKK